MAVWAILVTALAAPVFGAAATLSVGSESLAAGASGIARCDSDGFTESYTTSGGNVQTVVIGGIADPACEGGTMTVTVTDSAAAAIGSGSVVVATDGDTLNNSVTVTLSPTPFAGAVAGIHVSIVGP